MKEKITLPLRDLVQSQQALSQIVNMEFPAPVSFALAKVIRKVESELSLYEQERLKLLARMRDLPEETDDQKAEAAKIREEIDKEYEALVAEEISLDFTPFNINQFDKTKISPRDLLALSWLITE